LGDKFDRYREALVVEQNTVWPADVAQPDAAERQRVAEALHADPAACQQLNYVRLPTGFCRQITVTEQDLQRLGSRAS
jgi:hypothetical protein